MLSCHDISDGGIASALAEMTFKSGVGCGVTIVGNLSVEKLLFSETGGFVLESSSENVETIKENFSKYKLDVFEIGKTGGDLIQINNVINISVNETKEAWANGLREKL